MKSILPAVMAALAGVVSVPAHAAEATDAEAAVAERYRTAMKNARWTGPMSTPLMSLQQESSASSMSLSGGGELNP